MEDKPQYKGKNGLTKLKRVKISAGARCAITMRSKEKDTIGIKKASQKLAKDIRNSVWHVYGHHENCSADFCLSKKLDRPKDSSSEKASTENIDEIGEHEIGKTNGISRVGIHSLGGPVEVELSSLIVAKIIRIFCDSDLLVMTPP